VGGCEGEKRERERERGERERERESVFLLFAVLRRGVALV
jgi:hypothetical protein